MITESRLNDIMEIIRKKKSVSSKYLCNKLHCSVSTMRRDLITLEKQGLLRRTHGGAILTTHLENNEPSYYFRQSTNIKEKQYIANLALDFVGPGMSIFLDSSSTVMQLVPYLKTIPNLVVITNGLRTALELSEGNNESLKVFVTGGEVKSNSSAVISSTSDSIFSAFRFNLAVFSCRGIDKDGIYEASLNQAGIKQEMMSKAQQTILLADNQKFDSTHFFRIGGFADYDAIITDQKPSENYQTILDEFDVDILF